jgi:hypothetical protein
MNTKCFRGLTTVAYYGVTVLEWDSELSAFVCKIAVVTEGLTYLVDWIEEVVTERKWH